jgi:hypothetical protein
MANMSRRLFSQLMATGIVSLAGSASGFAGAQKLSGDSQSKAPDCTSDKHPIDSPREMMFLGNEGHVNVYGCRVCWDTNREQSIRVVTDPEYQRYVRGNLAKQGRLLNKLHVRAIPGKRPSELYVSGRIHGSFGPIS